MRKSAAILMVIGVALLVFAFTVPPYMQGQARTLPTDLDVVIVSDSPQGYTRTEHLTTAPTEEVDEIAVRVEQTVEDPEGEVVAEVLDQVTLIGHSRFPVLDPTAFLAGSPADHSGEIREGLHYFFPANTLRNSYQFYDITLGDAEPVDYVGREGDIYTFHQNRRFQPVDDQMHYSVERTLEVERESGIIIGKQESMIFHEPGGDREMDFTYTQDTRDTLMAHADEVKTTLLVADVLAFSAKVLGLVLIGIGLFRTGIFRIRR